MLWKRTILIKQSHLSTIFLTHSCTESFKHELRDAPWLVFPYYPYAQLFPLPDFLNSWDTGSMHSFGKYSSFAAGFNYLGLAQTESLWGGHMPPLPPGSYAYELVWLRSSWWLTFRGCRSVLTVCLSRIVVFWGVDRLMIILSSCRHDAHTNVLGSVHK